MTALSDRLDREMREFIGDNPASEPANAMRRRATGARTGMKGVPEASRALARTLVTVAIRLPGDKADRTPFRDAKPVKP